MSTINSWKAFIKAQEIFVNQYAEPFFISYTKLDKEGFAHFEIIQQNPLTGIIPILEKSFPGILEDDIKIRDGYLLYDSTLSPKQSNELKEVAEANYFEFDFKPCFSGFVRIKENPYKWIEDLNDHKPIKNGQILADRRKIELLDNSFKEYPGFSRLPVIGGVFKCQPS